MQSLHLVTLPQPGKNFASFSVNVLGPERTLFEELAAVHDAASRNDEDALFEHGRHFYDIYQLLQDDRVIGGLEALGNNGINDLIEDIDCQSNNAGFSSTAHPWQGYSYRSEERRVGKEWRSWWAR